MKKYLLSLCILLGSLKGFTQITYEANYPSGNVTSKYLRLIKLSSSGYKYVTNDTSTISLYNLNHTLFKTITIPTLFNSLANPSALSVYFISEGLFNTNPLDVEYFLFYTDKNFISHSKVYDEVGNLLFSKDSTMMLAVNVYGNESFISHTSSGTKMIIWKSQVGGNGAQVYSLPGTLTCHDCTGGVITSFVSNSGSESNSKISNYPNPSTDQTTVEYTLPKGINVADLIFFDISGKEIKRFKVTSDFKNIIINTSDLSS